MVTKPVLFKSFCLSFIILLAFASLPAFAQDNNQPRNYFGQEPPGMEPKKFAPGIVSTNEYLEWAGAFTPDGKEFFFTRWDGSSNPTNIYYSVYENDTWTEPAVAPFCSEAYNEMEPFITYDGQKIFFASARPINGGSGAGLWEVDKTASGWSEPHALGSPINDDIAMYLTISRDGTAYLTGTANDGDIFTCTYKNGEFSSPIRLEGQINTEYTDAHPFISWDESFLVFDSWRPGGPGRSNLYISFKEENGSWSVPILLNEKINRGDVNAMPMVTQDGKYFFFSSDNDIYWVDARILRESAPVDLETSAIKFKPRKPVPQGGSLKLIGKIRNNSEVYSASTQVNFYLSPKSKIIKKSILLGTFAVDSFQPYRYTGLKIDFSIPKNLKPRDYWVIASIDPDDLNTDPNKKNNIAISKKKVSIY